jgi:hypothetical protein
MSHTFFKMFLQHLVFLVRLIRDCIVPVNHIVAYLNKVFGKPFLYRVDF